MRFAAVLLLMVAMLFLAPIAAAEDDVIFTPDGPPPSDPAKPTPPPKSNPMVGTWFTIHKGGMICAFGRGTIVIASDGKGGINAHADLGGYTGDFSKITVKNGKVSFGYSYTDTFGDPALVNFDGSLSTDGNSISGTTDGTWAGGCTFTMQRN